MSKTDQTRVRPALDPASRENQLINLATNEAERRILDGTASSQIICHYLKLATERERLEREKIAYEKNLLKAKTDAIKAQAENEQMYAEVMACLKEYNGHGQQ